MLLLKKPLYNIYIFLYGAHAPLSFHMVLTVTLVKYAVKHCYGLICGPLTKKTCCIPNLQYLTKDPYWEPEWLRM